MTQKASVRIALLVTLICALTIPAWARKFAMTASQKVPAAAGDINAKTDKNGNTEIDLKVRYLAKPGNLTPPASAYVLWLQTDDSPAENEGQVRIGDNLKGEAKATTRSKNFDVLITAENDPLTKTPSSDVVLRTKVQM